MPLRKQPTARIDRYTAAERGIASSQEGRAIAARGEPQRLVVKQLRDREGVVHLDDVDVAGGYAGLLVSDTRRPRRDFRIENVVASRFDVAGLHGGPHDANR